MKVLSKDSMRLIIIVVGILLAANAVMGFVLVNQSKSVMKDMQQNRMLDVVKSAADMLDGDALKSLKAEDKDTPEYRKVSQTLGIFRDNIRLDYIYCVKAVGEKEFVFTVDPTVTDPGEFGSPITYTDALYEASKGQPAVDQEPYSDSWGSFYSAYCPVFDSQGQVAGIVAVDFNAHWFEEQIALQTNQILICMGISTVVCIFVVFMATGKLRRSIRKMTNDLADLAHDLDDLTWEMSDIGDSEELKQSMADGESHLDSLGGRIQAIKNGLRRYLKDANSQSTSIAAALSSDYRNIYYRNLDKDKGICYKAQGHDCGLHPGQEFYFRETIESFAKNFVVEEDRKKFLEFMHPQNIREALMEKSVVTLLFRGRRHGEEIYMTARVAAIKHPDNLTGHGLHAVGIGFKDVDYIKAES